MIRVNLIFLAIGSSLAELTPERSHALPIIIVDSNLTERSAGALDFTGFTFDFDIISGDIKPYGMRASMAVVDELSNSYTEIYVEFGFNQEDSSYGVYLGMTGSQGTARVWQSFLRGSLPAGNYYVTVLHFDSGPDPKSISSWLAGISYDRKPGIGYVSQFLEGPPLRRLPGKHLALTYTQWYVPWLDWSPLLAPFEGRPCLIPFAMRLNHFSATSLQNKTYTLDFSHNPSYKINVDDRCGSNDTSFSTSGNSIFELRLGTASDDTESSDN